MTSLLIQLNPGFDSTLDSAINLYRGSGEFKYADRATIFVAEILKGYKVNKEAAYVLIKSSQDVKIV